MTARGLDPWRLPSAAAFLGAVESGLAGSPVLVLRADPSLPDGLEGALATFMMERNLRVETMAAPPGISPAEVLGAALGLPPKLPSFLADHLDVVALVDARAEEVSSAGTTPAGPMSDPGTTLPIAAGQDGAGSLDAWELYLGRFRAERASSAFGLSVLLLVPKRAPAIPSLPELAWSGRLRRADVAIWADLHAPLERPEPLATLAAALSVELCGWRLDLAARLARARDDDLMNPLAWLALQSEDGADVGDDCHLNSVLMPCPVRLHRNRGTVELERRVWRAQLSALFPWLEDRRQAAIARHRGQLTVETSPRWVTQVDDIELGGLAWQLAGRVPRDESTQLWALSRMRNNLAHRTPVDPGDLGLALAVGNADG